jgi:hypothetical protein
VLVTLVDLLNLLKRQLVVVDWLGWVNDVPQLVVLPVQVVVGSQGKEGNYDHVNISKDKGQDHLYPKSKDVNTASESVETKEDVVKAVDVLGAVLATDADDKNEGSEDEQGNVDHIHLHIGIASGPPKVLSVICRTLTVALFIQEKQWP